MQITQPDARLVIAPEELPEAIRRGEWSLMVWIYASEEVREPSTLFSVGGHLDVLAHQQGVSLVARHAGYDATVHLDAPLDAGRWHLLAASIDFRSRRADAWLATDGAGEIAHDSSRLVYGQRGERLMRSSDPRLQPFDPTLGHTLSTRERPAVYPALSIDRSGLTVGAWAPGFSAAAVTYETLAIRDHALTDADVRAVWQSRGYYDPHSLVTTDRGGRMNGWRGCVFLTFFAMSPGANGPGLPEHKASYVGGPVLASNLIMLLRPSEFDQSISELFIHVQPVRSVHGMVYRSRLEPEYDGFFEIEPAPFDAPQQPIGPIGEKAAMLAQGPQGIVRVMVSANSRGVRGTLGPQPWAENFAHGFIQALLPQTAGVLMRPSTVLDDRGGWFGIDTSQSTPETTLVRPLHGRSDQWADWTRFGSGTLPGASRGSGPATSISPGGMYLLRCGPMPGSLLIAEAPLVYRSTLLAFPGSSDLVWEPERGLLQDGPGLILGDPRRIELDTTRLEHTLADEDLILTDTQLVLVGILDVRVGDAVVVTNGPGRGGVSVVTAANQTGGVTSLTFSHPFGIRPMRGSKLRIGPWAFVGVEHRFDPVPAGDDRTWRGQVLRAADDDKLGVMLYAASAWRPDVDGFVFGSAGQSGTGYTRQLESAFPGALEAWAAHAEPDVWIQGFAQQGSRPPAMWDYLDRLRAGLGDTAEIVWASDAVHAHTTHDAWHHYLGDTAADAGVPAIFAVGHPRVGSYFEQAASGMRTDGAHFSSFGSRVVAEAWIDQIAELATGDACAVADYDGDGVVSVFDLLVFQTDWEAMDPRADLDGDGRFLIFDFLVLLTAIDDCP